MPIGPLFFIIAIFYSAVGFGGGSFYIAMLALYDFPYESIPILALICNLIVSSSGVVLFYKKGHFKWKLFWPYIVGSIPMAFLGGRIPISKEAFMSTLGLCLFAVGVRLLFFDKIDQKQEKPKPPAKFIAFAIGSGLGLLSGLVGIGGGIFLAPLLLAFNWARPKEVAAIASFFIFINSLSSLFGQTLKGVAQIDFELYIFLFIAVFLGGQIGSRLGSGSLLSGRVVKKLTAILVVFVGVKVLFT